MQQQHLPIKVIYTISILSTLAMVLPVFSGYVMIFCMLLVQVTSQWRRFSRDQNVEASPLKHWLTGIVILVSTFWSGALIHLVLDESTDTHQLKQFLGHTLVKYGLLWVFSYNFIWVVVDKTHYVHVVVRALCGMSMVNFLYCLAQRQFGINWVKGFHAVLPPNRFAYDVFRVSGFTSHPLTLGYQLCVLVVFALGLTLSKRLSSIEKRLCQVSALFLFLTIMMF